MNDHIAIARAPGRKGPRTGAAKQRRNRRMLEQQQNLAVHTWARVTRTGRVIRQDGTVEHEDAA